jgi:hypothetical protein
MTHNSDHHGFHGRVPFHVVEYQGGLEDTEAEYLTNSEAGADVRMV